MRPQSSVGFGENSLQAQEFGQNYALYSFRSKGNADTYFDKTRGARIRSRFRSIYAHYEQKRIKLRRDRHSEKAQNSTVVLTANGEVYTHEEAQVFVHDLHLFVTVQLLEETPEVLSLGKLCEDHRYSYECVSGQKPRLTKDGKSIICKTDNFVPLVVPGLSANSGSALSSTSPSQDSLRREVEIAAGDSMRPASSSSSSPSLKRSDEIAPRRGCKSTPKTQNRRKKRITGGIRTTLWQIFLSGWRSSKKIWWTQTCLHPHIVLRNQIYNILRKWQQN